MFFHFEKVPATRRSGDFFWKWLFYMTFQTIVNFVSKVKLQQMQSGEKEHFFWRENVSSKVKNAYNPYPGFFRVIPNVAIEVIFCTSICDKFLKKWWMWRTSYVDDSTP